MPHVNSTMLVNRIQIATIPYTHLDVDATLPSYEPGFVRVSSSSKAVKSNKQTTAKEDNQGKNKIKNAEKPISEKNDQKANKKLDDEQWARTIQEEVEAIASITSDLNICSPGYL